ncbi:MAG: class A beta-lactamase-related serine hydrolase [Bacteroidetes bacterium]|nr:class A beta-lactamase-related serine hydrolase [Bacteroidota bacterium]
MMKLKYTILFFCCVINFIQSQFSFDSVILKNNFLKETCAQFQKYRIQILYTPVINGVPSKQTFTFNSNPSYVYCASLVKLPVSIYAIEKLNELKIPLNTTMLTDSCVPCHKKVFTDTSSQNKLPSIEHYIKKMFLVSDNEAFSRVYEFLGVDDIHKRLNNNGYVNTRIINRYDGNCFGKENYITNPINFINSKNEIIYKQPCITSSISLSHFANKIIVGKAYYNSKNKLIKQPKDFTYMNNMPLNEVHSMLLELIYNQKKQFNITNEQRMFLIKYLTMLPKESQCPKYNSKKYFDSYKKYFIYGNEKKIKEYTIEITNIVGQSYGFMVDCARIKDIKNNIEFILTASIYTNTDEIINDGKYEYNTIALPFFTELGKSFYNYHLSKK